MVVSQVVDFIADNPLAVSQTLLSGALTAATIIYTYFTWGQTDEMETTRKQSNQPVVKGGIGIMNSLNLVCLVKNTGNGAAHNVSAKMYFEDIDIEPTEFKIPILSEGEEYEFGFPLNENDGFVTAISSIKSLIDGKNSSGILIVEVDCENAFEEEYSYKTKIDVLDTIDGGSQIMYDGEEVKIRKAVEGIESNLSDIESKINQGYQDSMAQYEFYQKISKTIESNREIGFDELKYKIGVFDEIKLYRAVNNLQHASLVDYDGEKNLLTHDNVKIKWSGKSYKDMNEGEICDPDNLLQKRHEKQQSDELNKEPN